MSLFKRNKKNGEKRSFLTAADESLAKALGLDMSGLPSSKVKEATFYTCMRILSDSVSKVPLKMYQSTDNGTKKITNHYLYSKLKYRPNNNMSASDFWKMVEYQRNYFGQSVVVIETLPNGRVHALHPLNMENVEIWVDNATIIGKNVAYWYVYKQQVGERMVEYKFRNDEVLHFKGMTKDGIQGMAIKDYLTTTIENLQYGTQYTNKHFSGGLQAKGILQYTGDIEENAMNRLKARFEKMANGMDNVGKILPVPVGFTFSSINSTMADAQFFENMKLSMQQIAAAFGVKMHQLNDLSGAKFNNVSSQNDEFYRDTLLPIFTAYEAELTWKLLTTQEIESGMYLKFNVDVILRTDLETRYKAYQEAINAGFLTPNEARAKEDLPTVEGGDVLMVNGSMVPIKDVGAAYRKTDSEPPTEDKENPTEGGEENE